MPKKPFYFLLLMTLTACNTIRFKIPLGEKRLVSCEQGECVCIVDDLRDDLPASIEPIEDCNNTIGADLAYFEELEKFYMDKVKRLEVCLNQPRQCK